jgi:CBS domain-containing protein
MRELSAELEPTTMPRPQLPRFGRAIRRVWFPRALRRSDRAWDRVVSRVNGLELDENTILLAFALVIGILGAGGVIGFYKLIDLAYSAFSRWPGTVLRRGDLLLYRPLLTAAGLALAWHITERTLRGQDGPNIPFVQLAVARRNGDIPTRPALGVTAASAVTLGCGSADQTEFPVVDSNLMLVGVITIADLGRIAKDSRDLAPVLLAADLALPAETVQIGDSLLTVIRKMGVRGTGALPVVDQSNERLIGVVMRAHVLGLYQRALAGDHSGEAARPARP